MLAALKRHDLTERSYALFVGAHDDRKNVAFAEGLVPALNRLGLNLVATARSRGSTLRPALERDSSSLTVIKDPDDETLWGLYAGAAVLLHPSHAEGYGLPLAEAASVGTPFLSTPVGAAEELAVDAREVIPLHPEVWKESLAWVIDRRDELGDAHRIAATKLEWRSTAQTVLDVCQGASDANEHA